MKLRISGWPGIIILGLALVSVISGMLRITSSFARASVQEETVEVTLTRQYRRPGARGSSYTWVGTVNGKEVTLDGVMKPFGSDIGKAYPARPTPEINNRGLQVYLFWDPLSVAAYAAFLAAVWSAIVAAAVFVLRGNVAFGKQKTSPRT